MCRELLRLELWRVVQLRRELAVSREGSAKLRLRLGLLDLECLRVRLEVLALSFLLLQLEGVSHTAGNRGGLCAGARVWATQGSRHGGAQAMESVGSLWHHRARVARGQRGSGRRWRDIVCGNVRVAVTDLVLGELHPLDVWGCGGRCLGDSCKTRVAKGAHVTSSVDRLGSEEGDGRARRRLVWSK